jgi:hypothetical protein
VTIRSDHKKIAIDARRSASNEAGLVWSLGAVLVGLVAFLGLPDSVYFWVSGYMDYLFFSIVFGVVVGGILAGVYYFWAKKKIDEARCLNNNIGKATVARLQRDKQSKVDAFLAGETSK